MLNFLKFLYLFKISCSAELSMKKVLFITSGPGVYTYTYHGMQTVA